MWLERIGTVDQNIFFGFCAVVFVICVLVIVYTIVRLCGRHNTIIVPGYSLTSTLVFSTLLISVSVLFRGIQPQWGSINDMANVCQLFVPFISLGYILYGGSLLVQMWMLVIFYRFDKNTFEWLGHFVMWVLIVLVGSAVIVWEATFTPNVFSANGTNSSMDEWNMDNYTDGVHVFYECRGWSEDGSRDHEQFAWRIALSCLMALLLVSAILTVPFYACIHLQQDHVRRAAKAKVISILVVSLNTACCVISGLIVWFQYVPQTSSDLRFSDSNKYAIIGSLQLWMLLVAVTATLVAEIITMRTEKSAEGGKHLLRNHSNSKMRSTSFNTVDNTKNGKKSKTIVDANGVQHQTRDRRGYTYGIEAEDDRRGSGDDILNDRSTHVSDPKQDNDDRSHRLSIDKLDDGSVISGTDQLPTVSTIVLSASGSASEKQSRDSIPDQDDEELSVDGTFADDRDQIYRRSSSDTLEVLDDGRTTHGHVTGDGTETSSSSYGMSSGGASSGTQPWQPVVVEGNNEDGVEYVDFRF